MATPYSRLADRVGSRAGGARRSMPDDRIPPDHCAVRCGKLEGRGRVRRLSTLFGRSTLDLPCVSFRRRAAIRLLNLLAAHRPEQALTPLSPILSKTPAARGQLVEPKPRRQSCRNGSSCCHPPKRLEQAYLVVRNLRSRVGKRGFSVGQYAVSVEAHKCRPTKRTIAEFGGWP